MNYKGIGLFILNKRKALNMTQDQLGTRLGVEPQTIGKWERGIGAPDISQYIPLARLFEVTVEEILTANENIIEKDDAEELIINEQFIVEGKYLIPYYNRYKEENNDNNEKSNFKIRFHFKDFFNPGKMLRAFNKFMGGSGDLAINTKTLFQGCLKKHSREDIEDNITQGMFQDSVLHSYEGVKAPWMYIRLFFIMLSILGLSLLTDSWTMVIIMGSAVFPLSMLYFIFELNYPRNITIIQVLKCFFMGGLLSILIVFLMRAFTGYPDGLGGDILTGFIEETSKILIAFFFIKKLKPKYILSGFLIGAAIGAGFDVFETAEYAISDLLYYSYSDMLYTLFIRGLLSIGAGHLFWTAFASGALTMIIGNNKATFKHLNNINFLKVLLLSITLHACWNFFNIYVAIIICIIGLFLTFMQINVGLTQYQIAEKAYELSTENT